MAFFALGRLGPEAREAVPGLLRALDARNAEDRAGAAEVLGKIGAREALPALEKALRDPSEEVRRRAAGAAEEIRSLERGSTVRPHRTKPRGERRGGRGSRRRPKR